MLDAESQPSFAPLKEGSIAAFALESCALVLMSRLSAMSTVSFQIWPARAQHADGLGFAGLWL